MKAKSGGQREADRAGEWRGREKETETEREREEEGGRRKTTQATWNLPENRESRSTFQFSFEGGKQTCLHFQKGRAWPTLLRPKGSGDTETGPHATGR